jgi:hypothetical protein
MGDNLAAICEPSVCKMWGPRNPKGLHVVYGDNFTFTLLSVIHCHYEIREEYV